jgi:hypothetical protein
LENGYLAMAQVSENTKAAIMLLSLGEFSSLVSASSIAVENTSKEQNVTINSNILFAKNFIYRSNVSP